MGTYLITGTASGIGRATAQKFIAQGHVVYGIDRVGSPPAAGFYPLTADITDPAQIETLAAGFSQREIVLDGIIHIAGQHRMASLVEGDYTDSRRLIEINLLGPMLVTRCFHPFLAPRGRILIVTSEVAGFDPMPFNGLYNVSKTALDSYAQALRQELNLIGQKVITIRPGAVETPLSLGSMADTRKLSETTRLYRRQAGNFAGLAARFMGSPIPPHKIADLIFRAFQAPNPRLIYRIHQNIGLVALDLLPKRLQCWVIKLLLNHGKFQ